MAIARGAGTEIIRTAHFGTVDSTPTQMIIGVQHHIYTVLSIVVMATSVQANGNYVDVYFDAFDSKGAASAADIKIFRQAMNASETFVWNDKFSFNGHEPTGISGAMDSIVKQDAIADQGSSTPQYLKVDTSNASDSGHISVTYIDQNNA